MKVVLIKLVGLLLILIYIPSSEKVNPKEWVMFYQDSSSTHYCSPYQYQELKDLITNPIGEYDTDLYYYYLWEKDYRKQVLNQIDK